MNILWDGKGLKGVSGRFEISIIPFQDGWSAIIWVGSTYHTTLAVEESKEIAQEAAEAYLKKVEGETKRLLERIGYDDPDEDEEDDD